MKTCHISTPWHFLHPKETEKYPFYQSCPPVCVRFQCVACICPQLCSIETNEADHTAPGFSTRDQLLALSMRPTSQRWSETQLLYFISNWKQIHCLLSIPEFHSGFFPSILERSSGKRPTKSAHSRIDHIGTLRPRGSGTLLTCVETQWLCILSINTLAASSGQKRLEWFTCPSPLSLSSRWPVQTASHWGLPALGETCGTTEGHGQWPQEWFLSATWLGADFLHEAPNSTHSVVSPPWHLLCLRSSLPVTNPSDTSNGKLTGASCWAPYWQLQNHIHLLKIKAPWKNSPQTLRSWTHESSRHNTLASHAFVQGAMTEHLLCAGTGTGAGAGHSGERGPHRPCPDSGGGGRSWMSQ